jgi:hypothetical protein
VTNDPDRLRDFPSLAVFGDDLMRVARADSRSKSRFPLRRRALPLAVALVVLPVSLAGAEGGREPARVEFEPGCQPPEGTEVIAGRPYLGPDDPTEVEPPGAGGCPWKTGVGAGMVDPEVEPPGDGQRAD